MKIGLALPHYDFSFPDGRRATMAEVVATARRAEALGFDSVWVSDHLFLDLARYGGPPKRFATPEALAMMTAIAATTEQVRVGSLVLCASFRHPRILAEQLKAVDDLSGRRLDVGLGSGWYEAEFAAAGIPFGTAGQRLERLERVAGLLEAHLDPRPPLWIGGKGGPKVMRIVAEHADGWNVVWKMTPEAYRERLGVLDQACAAAGRDPATVRLSVGLLTLVGTSEADVAERYRRMQSWTPGGALDGTPLEAFAADTLVGTPDACAARVKEFAAAGVEELIVSPGSLPFSLFEDEQLELIARELIPLVR